MKIQHLFLAAMMVGSLLAVGCQKENDGIPEGAMRLNAEGYNGDKTVVSGLSVAWAQNDPVSINGNPYTVSLDATTGQAYTSTTVTPASEYIAYYPSNLSFGTWQDPDNDPLLPTKVQVTMPASYTSSFNSNGQQVIALPMVAYSADGGATGLYFKHITAAVQVNIKNTKGYRVYLDKVEVVSSTYKLNGRVVLDLTDPELGRYLAPYDGSTAERMVTVNFDHETVAINNYSTNNDIVSVQVPILPISYNDGNSNLTIRVYTHSDIGTVLNQPGLLPASYELTYSKSGSSLDLARNEIVAANVDLGSSSGTTTIVDHSLFTIASGKKVRFSQGNLQYIGSATSPYWKFADNQWGVFGDNGQGSTSTTADRDLFGWGTSGYNSCNPCNVLVGSTYCTSTLDISKTAYDWAYYNAIQNGGNTAGIWYTLSYDQWYYVLIGRPSNCLGRIGNTYVRFTRAKVNNILGLIIFPDNYSHPSGVTSPQSLNPTGTSDYNSNQYSGTNWEKMEAAGAVFIPLAGYRDGVSVYNPNVRGRYWTTTPYPEHETIRSVDIAGGSISTGYESSASIGYAVRAVMDSN